MKAFGGALFAAALIVATPALGRSEFSSTQAVTASRLSAEQIAAFSKQIETDLAERGARVAMVFRAGRGREHLPRGIGYTHGAFWVYRDVRTQAGAVQRGYAVYNLFAGDGHDWPTTRSRLVQDWPFEFTRGSTADDVGVIIPSPEMQRRILELIDSPVYARLHNPSYSLIANPWRDEHQNCVSFMLDVVAAAAWQTSDPAQIQADLRAHYKPTVVQANMVMRLFAPLADKRIQTDDQSGEIVTAAYESLATFMRDNGLLAAAYVLPRTPDPPSAGNPAAVPAR